MDTAVSVELFVEILNRYVYYFDQQNEAVSRERLLALEKKLIVLGHD
jgi:vacuolar protein sorting-associated protein 35